MSASFKSLRAVSCLALLAASACVDHTDFGKCVGLNGHEDSRLVYDYSVRNIFWGIFGIEIVYPPIKVALDEIKCPVARVATAPVSSSLRRSESGQ